MNNNVSKYKVIKNFENHLEIIQKLDEEEIEISEAMEYNLEIFKSLLSDFDKSKIDSFYNDFQRYKESQNTHLTHDFNLKEFDDFPEICKKLIENKLTLDDIICYDYEKLSLVLDTIQDQSKISPFFFTFGKI